MSMTVGKARPKDNRRLSSPYYLHGEDLFLRRNGREVFVKKVSSAAGWIPEKGAVILAPGIACNGNLFRVTSDGECLTFDHATSFANLLASAGYQVYLWHYSSSQRIMERYVSRFCQESQRYDVKGYRVPSSLGFDQLMSDEMPMVLDLVCQNSGREEVAWIGFSMGGMLAYAYLACQADKRIDKLITIGSPVSFSTRLPKLISHANRISSTLGIKDRTVGARISERFVLLSGMLKYAPKKLLRLDPLVGFLYNPGNVSDGALESFFSKIVEPIPAGQEKSFSQFVRNGFSSLGGEVNYLEEMRRIKGLGVRTLFFYGQLDQLAVPNSVMLAHEVVSPANRRNLVEVKEAGHNDLVIGLNSPEAVWGPSLEWLES